MNRLKTVLAILASLLAAGPVPASVKPCRDASGKIIRCPDAKPAPKRCKDASGKFTRCPAPGSSLTKDAAPTDTSAPRP